VYAFELAANVLLVAIVAAIALTLRTRKETKYQDPSAQLAVKAGDRLKVVKLAPEGMAPSPPPGEPTAKPGGTP
jgi:NADH-quinone oxidoreductase subunit J